jgi:hypothetical protein
MDNSELYAGLTALSLIERDICRDNARYTLYKSKAANVQSAIMVRLFDPVAGLYKNSANAKTNITQWYDEGVVAMIWPQLCGVETYTCERSVHQRDVLTQNFSEKNGKDWTMDSFIIKKIDPYPWASIGYAFSMAGDTETGHKQLAYVILLFKDPEQSAHVNIAEAGWGLIHLSTLYKKQ